MEEWQKPLELELMFRILGMLPTTVYLKSNSDLIYLMRLIMVTLIDGVENNSHRFNFILKILEIN